MCKGLRKRYRYCSYVQAMAFLLRLGARVLRRLNVAFACLIAMCKGFEGNVWQCLALAIMCKGFRETWCHVWICARVLKEMFSSCHYVQGFYGNVAPCVATCEGFEENPNEGK